MSMTRLVGNAAASKKAVEKSSYHLCQSSTRSLTVVPDLEILYFTMYNLLKKSNSHVSMQDIESKSARTEILCSKSCIFSIRHGQLSFNSGFSRQIVSSHKRVVEVSVLQTLSGHGLYVHKIQGRFENSNFTVEL